MYTSNFLRRKQVSYIYFGAIMLYDFLCRAFLKGSLNADYYRFFLQNQLKFRLCDGAD